MNFNREVLLFTYSNEMVTIIRFLSNAEHVQMSNKCKNCTNEYGYKSWSFVLRATRFANWINLSLILDFKYAHKHTVGNPALFSRY